MADRYEVSKHYKNKQYEKLQQKKLKQQQKHNNNNNSEESEEEAVYNSPGLRSLKGGFLKPIQIDDDETRPSRHPETRNMNHLNSSNLPQRWKKALDEVYSEESEESEEIEEGTDDEYKKFIRTKLEKYNKEYNKDDDNENKNDNDDDDEYHKYYGRVHFDSDISDSDSEDNIEEIEATGAGGYTRAELLNLSDKKLKKCSGKVKRAVRLLRKQIAEKEKENNNKEEKDNNNNNEVNVDNTNNVTNKIDINNIKFINNPDSNVGGQCVVYDNGNTMIELIYFDLTEQDFHLPPNKRSAPLAPNGPLYFYNINHKHLKLKNKDLLKKYNELCEDDKLYYIKRAELDKIRYLIQKKEYKELQLNEQLKKEQCNSKKIQYKQMKDQSLIPTNDDNDDYIDNVSNRRRGSSVNSNSGKAHYVREDSKSRSRSKDRHNNNDNKKNNSRNRKNSATSKDSNNNNNNDKDIEVKSDNITKNNTINRLTNEEEEAIGLKDAIEFMNLNDSPIDIKEDDGYVVVNKKK